MSETATGRKIPRSILFIGTLQVAIGLWVITSMAIAGDWNLVVLIFAVGYICLGAGLLAVMEWARFVGVVVHPMILFFLLMRVYNGESGFWMALQVTIVLLTLYILTRPHIRAQYRQTLPISSR